jgi:hypothetical protein
MHNEIVYPSDYNLWHQYLLNICYVLGTGQIPWNTMMDKGI